MVVVDFGYISVELKNKMYPKSTTTMVQINQFALITVQDVQAIISKWCKNAWLISTVQSSLIFS